MLKTPVKEDIIEQIIAEVKFDNRGLVPAIAQSYDSKDVLMMAWMNAASIQKTLETGDVYYWSRSRSALWHKGESSGHVQTLKQFRYDCDEDTILLTVDQTGPACHTNRPNCFYKLVTNDGVITETEPVV